MTIGREFVGLPSPVVGRAGAGGHPCQGVYHTPANQPNPTTAFIATHYNVDFSEHYLADFMAARGFGFLGWNTRFRGNEAYFLLDHALAEIAVGVQLVARAGRRADRSARQLGRRLADGRVPLAESASRTIRPGPRPQGRGRGSSLPATDSFVFLAAHPGRPEVLTDWMDPSVVDEADATSVDPDARHVQPGQRPAVHDRVRRPVPRRRSAPATTASPRGATPSSTAWRASGSATGCSRCPHVGRPALDRRRRSIRRSGAPRGATPASRSGPTPASSASAR